MDKHEVESKLAKSLTADNTDLIPFLSYLLQDLWELGSSPKDIVDLIKKNIKIGNNVKILDIACGKGSVSVLLAKEFNAIVKGIDIIPEFIVYAKSKAKELHVDNFCNFEVNDANKAVDQEKNYDLTVFGSVGDILGNLHDTLLKLKNTVKKGGYIVIDDCYGQETEYNEYPTRKDWLKTINDLNMKLIDEKYTDLNELIKVNEYQQPLIKRRAEELKRMHPDLAYLFDDYVKSQLEECDEIEDDLLCVSILIKT